MLGELGRYPMLIKGLSQVLKYDWHIQHKTSQSSLVKTAYDEMLEETNSWYSRVQKVKKLLNLKLFQAMYQKTQFQCKLKPN